MNASSFTIRALLSNNAEVCGDCPSILNEAGLTLSHRVLFDHVQQTIASLNQLGIGRNDRVAIVLPQGPELAVAFLSVAAGATAAPLNHNYKEEDFRFYLEDLQARALLVFQDDDSPARLAAAGLQVPIVELTPHEKGDGRFHLIGSERILEAEGGFSEADDIGLVLHTSGTTSRPKMVPLTHTNLCSSAHNIVDTVQLTAEDCCLNVMPLFHIHGLVACVLASLCAGGSTVCSTAFEAGKFFHWLKQFRPTWYSAVPTMHQAVLGAAKSGAENYHGDSLRFIRSSSAALPPPVMEGLENFFSVPVIESYGMTEAAHQMASNPLPPQARKPGSVGIAAGPEISILDESGEQLSQGETGEIAIRGVNVTPGYVNNPEANESSFTNGWFRTGDQGYIDAEGYLFLTGRLKEMINRGGENIAPREIDEALLMHPEIKQAVGFAVAHPSLGEDVAAAVILEADSNLDEAAVRSYAMDQLADFKVPSRVVILDDIPKGPTGKLQRIGLADKLKQVLEIDYQAPVTEAEKTVAAAMQEVMELESIGKNDNFFMLGGDSLRAAQVVGRLNRMYGLTMPVTILFQMPTVVLLGAHVDKLIADLELDALAGALDELSPEEQAALLESEDSGQAEV